MKIKTNLKAIALIIMLFILITTFSFSFFEWNNKDEEMLDISSLKTINNEKINIEKWTFEKTSVKAPAGIVFLGDFIYVTDKDSDAIVVLDKNGDFKRDSTESNLYLFEPTVIKTDGEFLYVIDSGYNQLKILSQNFDLINSINLPGLYLGDQYWDLEIIEEKIYLTAGTPIIETTGIFELNKAGTVHQFGKKFVGYLSNFSGDLMAINAMEYFEGEDETGQYVRGVQAGRNGLFEVNGDEFEKKFAYVSQYTPLDFLLVNNYIYVFSGAGSNIDKYSVDGQYLETVLNLDYADFYVQLESMNNSILLIRPTEDIIYKIDLN